MNSLILAGRCRTHAEATWLGDLEFDPLRRVMMSNVAGYSSVPVRLVP